jgi:hypothetical protein
MECLDFHCWYFTILFCLRVFFLQLVLLFSPNAPSDFLSQARILFNFANTELIFKHVKLTFFSLHYPSGYPWSASRTTWSSTEGACWRARTSPGASTKCSAGVDSRELALLSLVPICRRWFLSQLSDEVLPPLKKGASTDHSTFPGAHLPTSTLESRLPDEVLPPLKKGASTDHSTGLAAC